MPKKDYGRLEEHIIQTFQSQRIFTYHNKLYELLVAGKPRPQGSGGECKTDVYVAAKNQESEEVIEFKISVKSEETQEFQGNKLTKDDAEAYFGEGWENVIVEATTSLKSSFEDRILLYASGKHPTKPNSITVGWKLEIASKPRALSVKAPLTDQEIRDYIYKGTNQSLEKKNSCVEGRIIEGSGVADYLLASKIENIVSAEDVLSQMNKIDEANLTDTYLIFTANNYRTDVDKADGPRALAVRIEWECQNRKLVPMFYYDHPLMYTGEKDMRPLVKKALQEIGKSNISDIDPKEDLLSENMFLE